MERTVKQGQTLIEVVMVMLLLTVVGGSAFTLEAFRLNLTQQPERRAELSNAVQYALAHIHRTVAAGGELPTLVAGTPSTTALEVSRLTNLGGNNIADLSDFVPANLTTARYQRVNAALALDPAGLNLAYDSDISTPGPPDEVLLGPQSGSRSTVQLTALSFSRQAAPDQNQMSVNLTVQDTQTLQTVTVIDRAYLRGRSSQ